MNSIPKDCKIAHVYVGKLAEWQENNLSDLILHFVIFHLFKDHMVGMFLQHINQTLKNQYKNHTS